jgi:hypothetical protein
MLFVAEKSGMGVGYLMLAYCNIKALFGNAVGGWRSSALSELSQ